MDQVKISEQEFSKRQVPMPDLSDERIFPGGLRVKVLFEKDCKWRLVEEFGTESFWVQQYEDIIPGYYMNKMHCNSAKPDGKVPDELLKELLDKSYQLVLGRFSKKKQREILGIDMD